MSFEIEKIRSIDPSVKRIILSNINILQKSKVAQFFFINDSVLESNVIDALKQSLSNYLPSSFTAQINYEKRVCDTEILHIAIKNYLFENHVSLKALIKDSNIVVTTNDAGLYYIISVAPSVAQYFDSGELLQKLDTHLNGIFCECITGEIRTNSQKLDFGTVQQRADFCQLDTVVTSRFFNFTITDTIEGAIASTQATYMADCDRVSDNQTVCGIITALDRRLTKNQKPYFLFELDDTTYQDGRTFKAKMFPYKRTLALIEQLKVGDCIAAVGKIEAFNAQLSMMIEKVAYAKMPTGFEPEPLKSKAALEHYITITPKPYVELAQSDIFAQKKLLPDDIVNNTFVVFDIETTGLNNNLSGTEKMDAITEIGAVKIVGGEITQTFSTLIDPQRPIPEKIVKLTGITDQMVQGAPLLESVLPDFFKFTQDAMLVGHNVEFDYKFIRNYSKELGYLYSNRAFDTMTLSQELLPELTNHKLSTVAQHYNLQFNHHRAQDDALVTAKIFIELISLRKHLPK